MGNSPEEGSLQTPALADEQAALRRVATLVTRAASPGEVFAAVAAEVGRLLQADWTFVGRYNPGDTATIVAAWSAADDTAPLSYDGPIRKGGPADLVRATGRPVRVDRYTEDSPLASRGIRSGVSGPISVEGRLWGIVTVASTAGPLPPGTEARLSGFTELVATAIANVQARTELRDFADEQAALRRVATLVARGAPPEEVFTTVAAEVGRVLDVDFAFLSRYEHGGAATIVGAWVGAGGDQPLPAGTRVELGGRNVHTLVFQTGQPARIDDYAEAFGASANVARGLGSRSGAGVPIGVEGRPWGQMYVASRHEQPLPADTEDRLARFTELVATAVANAQVRTELRDFAEEQAALRRVATLVARGAPPDQVFAAVAAEAGRLVAADLAVMSRFDPGGASTVASAWASTGAAPVPVGTRWNLDGQNVTTLVFQTGQPGRIDDYVNASSGTADLVREWGLGTVVGVPVSVEGRLWGVLCVASAHGQSLPAETEARLAGFAELAATAVANAEAQAALTASRARIVAAADATRRRIERDLHDGAQQRLVSLGLQLRTAQAAAPAGAGELTAQLDQVADGLTSLADELREYARGIHPAILTEGGLGPALKVLARRSPIPVDLDVRTKSRFPEPVEVCAYCVISEALANAAKHSSAPTVAVEVIAADDVLRIRVRDDGAGGAAFGSGSGLAGLRDRVEALGGQFALRSEPGDGTSVSAQLPLATKSP